MAESFLKVVVDNLSFLIKEEIGLILGVDKEMKKLCSTLTTIQAVLEDAEYKQIESNPIRDWLCKLNALSYEIDDILDECNTHVSKLNHAHSKLSRYSIKKILYQRKIGRRMKQVTEKLEGVAAERTQFHLREMPLDRPREVADWRETRSMLNESDHIYGRGEDREKIVKMLVDDAREKQQISVLPIIGVGGLGKTTLAQLVFNDQRVVEHFDKKIWVCVSDNFEIKTLVKVMIESATGCAKASEPQRLDVLERCLRKLLSQKRYLIVLDDVWNDQQEKWFELKDILSCGSTGASIIVTTRLEKVAKIMGTVPAHCLKGLSDEHCWMLLRQRAFGQEEEEISPELEEIGKQIVKKCAGVPLAAKALGGILRFKRTEKEWMYVRESDLWKLSPEESLLLPALRLSYHHLPLELRQCFAYFAAFPKDFQVEKTKVILLWMAHGYISSKGTLQVEDVGNAIWNELVLRSSLQPTVNNKMSMHDLVHDLAQSVMENKVTGTQIERNIMSASTIREVNFQHKTVYFPKSFQQNMDISSIMDLTSIRVLDASYTHLEDLPHSIGNLIHLRYLNLSFCHEIRALPNSICTLWNLQILNLDYCKRLLALPKNTRYLHNLQHLCLQNCNSLSEMPSKMRELSSLKTLSRFVVGLNRGSQLEELECLNLSGRLEIRHLERVKDPLDAKKANIAEKRDLRNLSLVWWERNNSTKLGHQDMDEKVLEALEPHKNIEKLSIRGFSGRTFPLWMTGATLGKVVEIFIINCQNCRRLPNLGELSQLRKLVLENVGVEYIIEDEEVGSGNPLKKQFPALKELELCDLPNLKGISKEQDSKEAFPNLKVLWISRCSSLILPDEIKHLHNLEWIGLYNLPKMAWLPQAIQHLSSLRLLYISILPELETLPDWLHQITDLYVFDCPKVVSIPLLPNLKELHIHGCPELQRRCQRGVGEDWHNIAHIPLLLIGN